MFPCLSLLANYCECTLHILSLHNLRNYFLCSLACAQKGNSEQQFNPCKLKQHSQRFFSNIWIIPESDCIQWHRLSTLWQATLTFQQVDFSIRFYGKQVGIIIHTVEVNQIAENFCLFCGCFLFTTSKMAACLPN